MKPRLDDDSLELGEAVREMLLIRKMKQIELAKKTKLSTPYISLIVHNKVIPSVQTLVVIAKAFGITVSTLVVLAEVGGQLMNMRKEQRIAIMALTNRLSRRKYGKT